MTVKRLIIVPGLFAALFGAVAVAKAAEVEQPGWSASVEFDLLRDCPREYGIAISPDKAKGGDPVQPSTWETRHNGLSSREELGPHWTYQASADGPKVEFAALGAGRKERPGLMHLALGWDF